MINSDFFKKNAPFLPLKIEENNSILEFYQDKPMEAKGLKVTYDRSPNFFQQVKKRGSHFVVMGNKDKNENICFTASLSQFHAYINNQLQKAYYIGDLRIGRDRYTLLNWKSAYANLIQYLNKQSISNYAPILTAIIDDNKKSIHSLVNKKNNPFKYTVLSKYKMTNLLRKKFFYQKKQHNKNISVEITDLSSNSLLVEFLNQNRPYQAFAKPLNIDKEKQYPWYIIKKHDSIIAACTTKESLKSSGVKIKLTSKSVILQIIFKLFSLLPKNIIRFPKLNSSIDFLYVKSLCFDINLSKEVVSECLNLLLHKIVSVNENKNWHFVSFPFYSRFYEKSCLNGFYYLSMPMKLYSVELKTNQFKIKLKTIPGFEMDTV